MENHSIGPRLVARWESTRGAHFVELWKADGSGYYYGARGARGYMGNSHASDQDAISALELRVNDFQPDANKLPMKRVYRCSRCHSEKSERGATSCGACGEKFCIECDKAPSAHGGYHECN